MNTQHTRHITIGENNPALTYHVLAAVAARRQRERLRRARVEGFRALFRRIRTFGRTQPPVELGAVRGNTK